MAKLIDLTGQNFERLKALWPVKIEGRRDYSWECLCECGALTIVRGTHLRSGVSRSCGCLRIEVHTKHGETKENKKTPEYRAWQNMIKRCEYENDNAYQDYGGRGIKVCPEWRNSFERFLKDMGRKPSSRHSLDRIDFNGDYEPSNCRWAKPDIQAQNQRVSSRSRSGVRGVYFDKRSGKYVVQIDVEGKTKHIGYYSTFSAAVYARGAAEREFWKGVGAK